MPIATVNPANGETLKTYDALTDEEIEHRLLLAAGDVPHVPHHHVLRTGPAAPDRRRPARRGP